jgi:Ankyrin repeat
MLRALLKAGANVNAQCDKDVSITPLTIAMQNSNALNVMKELVKQGADLNQLMMGNHLSGKFSVLHYARDYYRFIPQYGDYLASVGAQDIFIPPVPGTP